MKCQTGGIGASGTKCKKQRQAFHFLDYDGVPWNNDNAEHAVRAFYAPAERNWYKYAQRPPRIRDAAEHSADVALPCDEFLGFHGFGQIGDW
jgi:hypothetical protein